MANGEDLELEAYWEDVPEEEMTQSVTAMKHCMIAQSKAWKNLKCQTHEEKIGRNGGFIKMLIGMGLVLTVFVLPLLFVIIENWDKIFK